MVRFLCDAIDDVIQDIISGWPGPAELIIAGLSGRGVSALKAALTHASFIISHLHRCLARVRSRVKPFQQLAAHVCLVPFMFALTRLLVLL